MKTQVVNILAAALVVACTGAAAQKQGNDAVIGEKGSDAIVGEKGRDAIVGEKREARSATATIPPEVSRMMQRSGAAVRFRPPTLKLQQLPPEVLAARPTAQDLGAPFRLEPSTNPGGDRRWYVVNAAELGSGQDNIGLLSDAGAPRLAGKFGLTFRVEPGFRYLVDCAVTNASEMAVTHTGFGQTANEARTPVNSGFVSVISPPVRSGGTAWIEFKAMRAQGAAWRWRGCEVTPLRSSA